MMRTKRGTTEIHRVTQTRTDLDRPVQTRTDLIKRTFGTLFGTLKVLFDQLRSFLGTKLDLFGFLKVILDQLLVVIDRTERFGSAEPPNHVVRQSSAEPPNQAFYRTEPNQGKN